MEETIKDRYNKILTDVQRICMNYFTKINNAKTRHELEIDLKRMLDGYVSNNYIDGYDVDCGESFNPPEVIKRGEISFMYGIIWKGKRQGGRNTFRARKI